MKGLTAIASVLALASTDLEPPSPPTDLRAWVPKAINMTWELSGDSTNVPVYSSTDLSTWTLWTNLPGGTVWFREVCREDRRFFRVANQ